MQKYTLPELGYNYNALEPFIDAQTMEIHYSKHHQTYVDKLNAALEKFPELYNTPLPDLLKNLDSVPEEIRSAVRNHGGGHLNHSFFWTLLKINNGAMPTGTLADAITRDFENFENFKTQFTNAATNQFGSGWAWLVKNMSGGLKVISLPNQDSPVSSGLIPLLALDVWEHAYYLKYQNKRADYITAFWNIIDWTTVENNFKGQA